MKKWILALAVLSGTVALAQNDPSQKFAALIKSSDLQKHLQIIAGEEMEGRETGTVGQRRAAAYIEQHFKNLNLAKAPGLKSYQQFYPLLQDTLIKSLLTIGEIQAAYGTDFISPVQINENAKISSQSIVFAGYGIDDAKYNDYQGINVTGKTVLIILGEPKENGIYLISGTNKSSDWTFPGLSKKLQAAAKNGAAAVMVINPNSALFTAKQAENSRRTNMYYPRDNKEKQTNHAVLSHEFARKIFGNGMDSLITLARNGKDLKNTRLIQTGMPATMEFSKQQNIIEASNVLGVLEGTDKKDEILVLTAHYDHLGKRDGKIYYGADDDGSGTVAVMQMAEAFTRASEQGQRPRRTIVFMTVSGEEKGLWGSEYYSDHPLYPLEKTTADLNIDMIGRVDTERIKDDTLNYVYVVGHDKISTELPLINEGMNAKYTNLTLDYKFDDPNDPNRIYFRSDHYNFARKGVPVLFFYDGMLKSDYHKPTDTVEKINWALYEKRAQMIFHTAWEMANREKMLVRDLPIPTATR